MFLHSLGVPDRYADEVDESVFTKKPFQEEAELHGWEDRHPAHPGETQEKSQSRLQPRLDSVTMSSGEEFHRIATNLS